MVQADPKPQSPTEAHVVQADPVLQPIGALPRIEIHRIGQRDGGVGAGAVQCVLHARRQGLEVSPWVAKGLG